MVRKKQQLNGSRKWPVDQLKILAAINALYIGFGAVMGAVQGGLPPILRHQGYDVSVVGWVYAFYLPFGLAFLWAHQIDRCRLPWFGHRSGWIVVMQAITIAAVFTLAFGASLPVAVIVALGFVVTFSMATMDTALDAMAVEEVAPEMRSFASGLKLAALSLGAMIGNGLFVIFFSRYGWTAAFFVLLLLLQFVTLPLGFIASSKEEPRSQHHMSASLKKVMVDPLKRNRLLLVTLVSCVIFPLAALNRIMLVDLKVPLETIGWILGTLGPISMLLVSIIAMPLMQRFGLGACFSTFSVLGVFAVVLLSIASAGGFQAVAICGSILVGAAVSGIYVTVMAKILGWAAGVQPATDYAAYYGFSRLISTILSIVAAQAVAFSNWTAFYGFGAFILAVVLISSGQQIFRNIRT